MSVCLWGKETNSCQDVQMEQMSVDFRNVPVQAWYHKIISFMNSKSSDYVTLNSCFDQIIFIQ